jgi:hypothetical protein
MKHANTSIRVLNCPCPEDVLFFCDDSVHASNDFGLCKFCGLAQAQLGLHTCYMDVHNDDFLCRTDRF